MKHAFSSSKTDSADTSLVNPSNWNEPHVIGWTALSTNTTLTTAHDGILATAGAGGITLTLPAASARAGLTYFIKRPSSDTGAGSVVINRAGSDTIDGQTSYTLSNQRQYVKLSSDGTATWQIIGGN